MRGEPVENPPRKALRRDEVKEVPFLAPEDSTTGRMFCEAWESNPHVMFHGTNLSNLDSILEKGFLKMSECRRSFGKTSVYGLVHWLLRREGDEEGVVIVVRFTNFGDLDMSGYETAYLRDDSDVQPEILGYMRVPAASEYRHV